jgi:hypothetical protein
MQRQQAKVVGRFIAMLRTTRIAAVGDPAGAAGDP